MSRILYTYEHNMPTVAIFRSAVERDAPLYGYEVRFRRILDVTPSDLDWCDVLEMIRPDDPFSVHLAKLARESGRFVNAYYDDDLYHRPAPYPFWRRRCVARALAHAHVVGSSSPYICDMYRPMTFGNRSVFTDTSVSPNEIKRIAPLTEEPENTGKVRLIYAANPGHIVFFNRFILPIMPQLCERYAGKISMTFMGVRPDLAEYESLIDIEYFSTMPLEEYRKTIWDGGYDIGLSPLISDEFTKCKYYNKFIEYSMAGIVGLYSNTEPYTYIVKDGENGFLVNDAPEDWYECLCRVIDDALLRNRCICAAQATLDNFTPERICESNLRQFPEVRDYSAPRTSCKGLQPQRSLYRLIPVLDKVYQVFFHLRKTGISGLINKTKIHFREKKAYSK